MSASKGAKLQKKIEDDVTERAQDIPYPQAGDSLVSGYNTGQRADIENLGPQQRYALARRAATNRASALQGLQSLGGFTTMMPEDFQFYLQEQLVDANGIVPGIGKSMVGGDHPYWEYAAKKEALKLKNDFEAFKLSQVNLSTPEARQFWEKKFPELTKMLREGLRKDRENRAKLEDIGLYGVQDEKDLWILYEREKGFSRLPLGTTSGAETGLLGEGWSGIQQRPLGIAALPDQGPYSSVPGVPTYAPQGNTVPTNLLDYFASGFWSPGGNRNITLNSADVGVRTGFGEANALFRQNPAARPRVGGTGPQVGGLFPYQIPFTGGDNT